MTVAIGHATRSYNPRDVLFMPRENASRVIATLEHHSPVEWYDYLNVSSAFFVLERTDLALLNARTALSLDRNPATLLNLAVILETLGGFYPAFSLSEEAFALDPDDSFIRTHYSDALLRMGRLAEAWPIYSSSHANWSFVRNVIPEWDGVSSLAGKRVLVLSGGGYGDNILFLRWMPNLKSLGRPLITYMCPRTFAPLLARFPSVDRFIAGSIAGLDEDTLLPRDYDCYVSLLSLGAHFCPTMSAIPTVPYILADAHASWVQRGARPLVGICTRAGEEKFPRRHRSLSQSQTIRLLSALPSQSASWVNLNFDVPLPVPFPVVLNTWAETASVVANLDLVVTVDTGVAHLAGAMGVPALVLLPGMSASYYGVTGERCAFYPSHRLFRNFGEGIDNSVADVCAALATMEPR